MQVVMEHDEYLLADQKSISNQDFSLSPVGLKAGSCAEIFRGFQGCILSRIEDLPRLSATFHAPRHSERPPTASRRFTQLQVLRAVSYGRSKSWIVDARRYGMAGPPGTFVGWVNALKRLPRSDHSSMSHSTTHSK